MLHLVPTPIGNLGDITIRAMEVLRTVDYILAEDTRTTGKLLKHLEIDAKMRAFHTHNEHRALEGVVADLLAGMNIAMVSDAGTPGISDPAFLLVRACAENDIKVSCLPGPTALIPALVMAGFPTDRFVFEGFLPHKKGRKTRWERIVQHDMTVVLYESPHRIGRFLREAADYLPERKIAVVREISKVYESVHRGTAIELTAHFDQHPSHTKGEMVVVIQND